VELVLEHFDLSHADIRAHATIVENAALIREVEASPGALAPVSVGEAERKAQAGAGVRLLAFDRIDASSRSIANGSYALARPLALVTRRLPEGLARQFIDFALSRHVADLVAEHDFVPYEE
jgi:phosphate transport system substrate-binding protein